MRSLWINQRTLFLFFCGCMLLLFQNPLFPQSDISATNNTETMIHPMDEIDEFGDIEEPQEEKGSSLTISDPLEPLNRAVFYFNDKLYLYLLRPISTGYAFIIPSPARKSTKNFFYNIAFPVRFINNLFQANFHGAAIELGRFTVNTFFGFAGLIDLASRPDINLPKQHTDLGHTFCAYGIKEGIFLNLPILGPSTIRDAVGTAGDLFLHPVSWLDSEKAILGITTYEKINTTSLTSGEYESFKKASLDPYTAMKNGYIQYRHSKKHIRK